MGFSNIFSSLFKKPKGEKLPTPPQPIGKVPDSFSKQENSPPQKMDDFNNEIPELPDLDIPEELGGIDKFIPDDSVKKPHPTIKENLPPPPKATGEVPLPDLPPLKFEEDVKPIKVGSPLKEDVKPIKEDLLQDTKSKTGTLKHKTTFVNQNYEYIMEDEFTKVFTNLEEIQAEAANSKRYLELIKLHNSKEKKIKEFKDLMQKVYDDLNYVQNIVFEKGEKNGR